MEILLIGGSLKGGNRTVSGSFWISVISLGPFWGEGLSESFFLVHKFSADSNWWTGVMHYDIVLRNAFGMF